MKLGAKSAPAPAEEPADTTPTEEPTDTGDENLDFSTDTGDAGTDDTADTGEQPADDAGAEDTGSSDKPFDDEPFDAGVEADEEEDPKKFIEQLTGKLGQSLRKYTEDKGEPDFELEKFAVNSLLSATHTGEMDSEDQKDIIKKVKKSGKGDDNAEPSDDTEETDTETTDTETTDGEETTDTETTDTETTDDAENMFETEMLDEMSLGDYLAKDIIRLYDASEGDVKEIIFRKVTLTKPFPEEDQKDKDLNREKFLIDLQDDVDKEHLEEILDELKEMGIYKDVEAEISEAFENSFILQNPPKNNMFQEGSNDILDEACWKGYKKVGMKTMFGKKYPNCVKVNESLSSDEYEVYDVIEEGRRKRKKTKKDACYHKVKARYDVWPSAYGSGALVKCRKVGAANWGNSTDESVEVNEGSSKEEMKKKCTRIAKRKHEGRFPSVKATEDIMFCIAGKIWADEIKKLNESIEVKKLNEYYDSLQGYVMYGNKEKQQGSGFVEGDEVQYDYKNLKGEVIQTVDGTVHSVYGQPENKDKIDSPIKNWVVVIQKPNGKMLVGTDTSSNKWGDIKDLRKKGQNESLDTLKEKWSAKYKRSIDCNNPKGFSQKAHCQGRKKHD